MNLSFQLYSARNFTPWSDVFGQIAALGYTQVEGFGGCYEDVAGIRALLDEHGLSMPSGHFFPLDTLEEDLNGALSTARTLGMEVIYCPAPTDEYRQGVDLAAWIALAKRLDSTAARVRDAGLRFGWHNHHWEFMPLSDGAVAMSLLLEHAPTIEWEADIAWIVRGGADPLTWISRHGDRISAAHVKDIAAQGECTDEDGWADVGHGTIDWKAMMAALRQAGVSLYVVEHDNPSDLQRFAERSMASFRQY